MDQLSEILHQLSSAPRKPAIESISLQFSGNPDLFRRAMLSMPETSLPNRERLAWALQLASEHSPEFIDDQILHLAYAQLEISRSDAERRAMANILRNNWIPADLLAAAFDFFLEWFADPARAIAVRVYSLDILLMIVEKVPEFGPEFNLVVQQQMNESAPPAFLAHRYHKIRRRQESQKAKNKR